MARYVDATDPVTGQQKIDRILSEHYTESSKKELIKSAIREKGEYTLLGQLAVRLEAGKDHYWADVPALGENTVRISQKVLAPVRRRAADQRRVGHDGHRVRRHLRDSEPQVPLLH